MVSGSVGALEIHAPRSAVSLPAGRTLCVPLNARDTDGSPLTWRVVSISPKALTAQFAPAGNRSLRLLVAGVDAADQPWTGVLRLQLFEDLTPVTTARIRALVESGFYNGLTFHRIMDDFVAQGGDPNGDGTGGSGVTFDDEFHPLLTFTGFGQLAMANSGDDSNDSQFFITDTDLALDAVFKRPPQHLNFNHTIFGQLTDGFAVFEKLISTPVSGDAPLSPPVILSAQIVSNVPDAVLRLTAVADYVGPGTVVVSATTPAKHTATATLHVQVLANTVNDPPFLGPIPARLVCTQGEAVSFPLQATELDPTDQLSLGLQDAETGFFPWQFLASIDAANRIWLVPAPDYTGTSTLILGVTDNQHPYDTQRFQVVVRPRSEEPTLRVFPKTGSLLNRTSGRQATLRTAGTFQYSAASDRTFGSHDVVYLRFGAPDDPFTLYLPPMATGRSFKNGTLRFKTALPNGPVISAQFNGPKGSFKLMVSQFDLPVAVSNAVLLGFDIGPDHGTNVTDWVESKPGLFTLPKP